MGFENVGAWLWLQWARWFPDLLLDWIGGKRKIRLSLDQRVILRAILRNEGVYLACTRSYGKTFLEILAAFVSCMVYPGITIAIVMQTYYKSSKLLSDKLDDIVSKYPGIVAEIKPNPGKKDKLTVNSGGRCAVTFKNGSEIDNMPNSGAANGSRRNQINIEESFNIDTATFNSSLKDVVNERRCVVPGIIDMAEPTMSVNYYTTTGVRGSSDHERAKEILQDMCELKGKMRLSAGWRLATHYGAARGKTRERVLEAYTDPNTFMENYECRYSGATDGALADPDDIKAVRVMTEPETEGDEDGVYTIGVDVAHSTNENGCLTVISVIRHIYDENGKLDKHRLVNMYPVSGKHDYEIQAMEVKKAWRLYNAELISVDGNSGGIGLYDRMKNEQTDPDTGEIYPAIGAVNLPDDDVFERRDMYYMNTAEKLTHEVYVYFRGVLAGRRLELLPPARIRAGLAEVLDADPEKDAAFLETDKFVEELLNLKIIRSSKGNINVERKTARILKDRVSSVAYNLMGAKKYLDYTPSVESKYSIADCMF